MDPGRKLKATEDENAGTLTGKFKGHSIRVATVKGNDHGVIRITILDSSDRQIYQKELILTRQNEKKVQNL